VNATTDGVVRPPSELVITVGSPPSITATTELVVPKSIPMILLIFYSPKTYAGKYQIMPSANELAFSLALSQQLYN
jgi:hypothetical protein